MSYFSILTELFMIILIKYFNIILQSLVTTTCKYFYIIYNIISQRLLMFRHNFSWLWRWIMRSVVVQPLSLCDANSNHTFLLILIFIRYFYTKHLQPTVSRVCTPQFPVFSGLPFTFFACGLYKILLSSSCYRLICCTSDSLSNSERKTPGRIVGVTSACLLPHWSLDRTAVQHWLYSYSRN